MKNWMWGFAIGLLLIVVAFAVVVCANIVVFVQTGGQEISTYHMAMLIMVTWFMEVAVLIPHGAVPFKVTWSAVTSRWVFVWGPVALGWYLAHHMGGITFLAGLIISSTCVGYNLVVTNVKKKT